MDSCTCPRAMLGTATIPSNGPKTRRSSSRRFSGLTWVQPLAARFRRTIPSLQSVAGVPRSRCSGCAIRGASRLTVRPFDRGPIPRRRGSRPLGGSGLRAPRIRNRAWSPRQLRVAVLRRLPCDGPPRRHLPPSLSEGRRQVYLGMEPHVRFLCHRRLRVSRSRDSGSARRVLLRGLQRQQDLHLHDAGLRDRLIGARTHSEVRAGRRAFDRHARVLRPRRVWRALHPRFCRWRGSQDRPDVAKRAGRFGVWIGDSGMPLASSARGGHDAPRRPSGVPRLRVVASTLVPRARARHGPARRRGVRFPLCGIPPARESLGVLAGG